MNELNKSELGFLSFMASENEQRTIMGLGIIRIGLMGYMGSTPKFHLFQIFSIILSLSIVRKIIS